MSNYIGPVACKDCGSAEFLINDWETYCSVICARCEHKIGELAHPPYQHYGMTPKCKNPHESWERCSDCHDVCTWCDTLIELNEATGRWFVPGGYYFCPESPNDLHAT